MSLVFIDSFDHYNSPPLKWTTGGSSSIDLTGTASRTGIGCLAISGLFAPSLGISPIGSIIVGGAYNTQQLGFDPIRLFNVGNELVQVLVNGDGSISIADITGTRAQSASGIVNTGTYNYIELKAIINSASSGTASVHLNGAAVPGLSNIAWTPNLGLTTFTNVTMVGPGNGLTCYVDDFYICNTLGSVNNDFLGPIRIYCEMPVANGTPLQWTPSTTLPNYEIVNVIPPNAAQNVIGAAVSHTDQYVYRDNDVPANSLVFGVQHVLCAQLASAGSRNLASDVGGNVGPSTALSTSQHMVITPYDTNPTTGNPWSLTDLPGTQFGPTVTSS